MKLIRLVEQMLGRACHLDLLMGEVPRLGEVVALPWKAGEQAGEVKKVVHRHECPFVEVHLQVAMTNVRFNDYPAIEARLGELGFVPTEAPPPVWRLAR